MVPSAVDTTVPIGTPDEVEQREPGTVLTGSGSSSGAGADAWRDLQVQFVDDPTGAVEGAVRLVREALEGRAGADGSADTEHLRRTFTRLRDVHALLTADPLTR